MSTTIESLELEIVSNSKSAVDGIDALTQSLAKLKTATGGGLGLSSVSGEMKDFNNTLNKVRDTNKKSASSFTDIFLKLKSVGNQIVRVGSKIFSAVEKSMDYTENMNLFSVAMGEYAGEAMAYAEEVSGALGIDTSEWIRSQGIFMTLATGFGVAGDRAKVMSQNLTQLGYDLASFYNMDTETAMLKLKSGLAGELEPLRDIGYDLSQAKLQATAVELGITKSVSAMTQAEKAQLRYYAIMTQVTEAQGDMARTLDDPANQMRVFKAQMSMATREIGNMFIPALNAILPYATAVAKVIGAMASTIAGLFGYKDKGIKESSDKLVENTGGVTDNLEDAQKEAKKLKSYMLGFDELNVINPNTDSALEDTSGWLDFELPDYSEKFLDSAVETRLDDIVKKMKDWLGITEDITSWSDLLSTNFGNILVAIGLLGTGFATLGIGKLIKDLPKLKKYLAPIVTMLKAMGAAAVIASAVVGAKWLIDNTEDTMTEIGAIISGAALAVGAILAFTGINLPLGIALMAVGAVSMGTAIAMNTDKLSDEVKGVIAIITTAVSLALLAVGAILAFSGVNIPLGIALIAGGALTLATAIVPQWNTLSDSVQEAISILTAIIGGGLLALGGVLAFSGVNLPLGIALMAVGAASLGTAIALNWNTIEDALRGPIGAVTALVSGAVLAVGALLAFTGVNIPLGIALMLVGAAGLATVVALNWNSIVDALRGPIGAITAVVSGALLALGAILAFTGVGIPIGIALMLVGAAGLATVVAVNWNSIADAMRGPVGLITAIVGGALLVLGAILLFTGVGIPLGLGLMLAGAAGLGSAVAFNWDFLVEKIKGIWESIKTFWNTYIAPIFTADWWLGLGKTCINGLISGFEWGINGIISLFETMINWVVDGLNKISFDIPDWVPLIGGKTFGFNIPRVSFGRVSFSRFEEGGFPEQGQMFIAREAGPEMVGNIGRRTAVANNDQIVASISGGVAEANEEQNALLREQNSLLRAILEKDSGVYLDGKNLANSVEKHQRERGRVLITGGVV